MRICLLANALSIHTKRWIDSLRDMGSDVYLISFRGSNMSDPNFHFWSPVRNGYLYKSIFVLKSLRDIKSKIWEINPDVLHAHYLTSYGLLGVLSTFRPLVVSVWGSDLFVDARKSVFHRHIIKSVLEKADLVTVMANHMIAEVEKLSCVARKTIKVTLGVNTDKFNIEDRIQENGRTVILSNRVFEKEQNIEYIIDSLPHVIHKIGDVEIRFYGDGSRKVYCQELAKKKGLERNTTFLGFVDHEQMANYYKQADIYVSSSTSDGDHVSLMEAMACGLFPVVSDIPANREWIDDGKNGFLVPVDDKPSLFAQRIVEAINKRKLRERVRKHNFELIRTRGQFGRDLELLLQHYDRLINDVKQIKER